MCWKWIRDRSHWQKSRILPTLDVWVFLTSNTVKHPYCTGAQDSSLTLYMYPVICCDSFTRFFKIGRSLFDNTTRRQAVVFPPRPIHRPEKLLLTKTKTICHIEHCVDCPITVYIPVHNGTSTACLRVQKHWPTCFSSLFQVPNAKETLVSFLCIFNSYFPQF